jgi:hypothetical protein
VLPADVRALNWASSVACAESRRLKAVKEIL